VASRAPSEGLKTKDLGENGVCGNVTETIENRVESKKAGPAQDILLLNRQRKRLQKGGRDRRSTRGGRTPAGVRMVESRGEEGDKGPEGGGKGQDLPLYGGMGSASGKNPIDERDHPLHRGRGRCRLKQQTG